MPLGISLSGIKRHDSLMLATTLSTRCHLFAMGGVARGAGRINCMPTKLTTMAAAALSAANMDLRRTLKLLSRVEIN